MSRRERDPSRTVGVAFALSALSSIGLTIVYALGGQPQLEGLLLGLALGGMAAGIALFAKGFFPGGHFVDERAVVPHSVTERPGATRAFAEGAEPMERRRFLGRAFAVALGALGLAAVFPIRSLGTRPGRTLFVTAWTPGARLVTERGDALRPEDLVVNSVLTVYPEGYVDSADSQTLLIRLPDDVPPPGPADWSVDGVVAFSKICTHAGCPVGLYEAETYELFCPCHQSTFSVPDGAMPTFGPATRPLPQLPLDVTPGGFLVARSDFLEPVGPGFWSRPE